mgnify:FL=1|jgi:DNA repair exonuclease SbcCD ATPase subunit
MYVKKLELLNFQVIKEFNANFDGNVYLITGDNELGKSTLLKAIGALLTGNRDNVLRKGESKGFAKMVVGDGGEEYEVSLNFTEANPRGTLTIKSKSGMKSNNVSMLQSIFGYQDFDAVEFSRWSETAEGRRKQIEVVKKLLPDAVVKRIDEIDNEMAQLKDERLFLNRDVKSLKSVVDDARKGLTDADIQKYSKKIDVSDLMQEQSKRLALIEKSKSVKSMMEQRTRELAELPVQMEEEKQHYDEDLLKIAAKLAEAQRVFEMAQKEAEIEKNNRVAKYMAFLADMESKKTDLSQRKENAEKWLADFEKRNITADDLTQRLAQAEEHNRKSGEVATYLEKYESLKAADAKVEDVETRIGSLSGERAELIANSHLPIEGLTFSDSGLELNGIPFMAGNVSDSQIMEVATKLIIASNPKVKVFRIARGESLGEKRLEAIVDVAKKNGFQGFIEQVQRGQNDMIIEEYTEANNE